MHYEGAGREVQVAGSSGGPHAEGAEVSPTTEGRRHGTGHFKSLNVLFFRSLVPLHCCYINNAEETILLNRVPNQDCLLRKQM